MHSVSATVKVLFSVSTAFAIAVILCLPAHARKITLADCIETALQNNPNILEIDESWKKSVSGYRYAQAQRGLKVDGQVKTVERLKDNSSSDSNVRIPGKDTNIGLFAGLYAYYYLYDAERKKNEEVSKAKLAVTKIESDKVRSDVIFNVKKAYYDYLLAVRSMELRKKLLDKAKEKQKLVKTMYDNGLQPALDVMQTDVSFSRALLEYERTVNTERMKRNALYVSMGISENKDAEIVSVSSESLPAVRFSAEELNKLALLFCHDLRLAEERRKVSKINIDVAKAANKPIVFISMGLGMENEALYLFTDDDGSFGDNFKPANWGPVFTAAITASIPVYYSGAISAKIDSAVADYNSIMYQERSIKIRVQNAIADQYTALGELKKQIDISKQITENSRRYELLARRSYENGAGTLLDLQNAEENVLSAELNFLDTVYQYYLTLATLAHTLGVEEEQICQN